jgi:hydrogenase nickel incorporation protein HypA/HybF
MHELSITQNILDITLKHANQANAKKVTDLFLVIGQLSSIVDESVQFYWDFVSADTIAEGAVLHFRRIPTELICQNCNRIFQPDGNKLSCPNCGSDKIQVKTGDEFYLEAIDIDNGEEDASTD